MSRSLVLQTLLVLVELRDRLACAAVGVGAEVVPPAHVGPVLLLLDDEPTEQLLRVVH